MAGCTWVVFALFSQEVVKVTSRYCIANDAAARWCCDIEVRVAVLTLFNSSVDPNLGCYVSYKNHNLNEAAFYLGMALPATE